MGAQAEAKELGICCQVVPGGNAEVRAAAEAFAEQILACSPDAIQASLQVGAAVVTALLCPLPALDCAPPALCALLQLPGCLAAAS